MPALVVWERLIFAGDDLRCIATLTLLIRIVQICMVIFIVASIIKFDHRPEFFVRVGCISSEGNYWLWYSVTVAGCFFTLTYGVIGALVEMAIFKVSGMGSPTETDARSVLVPLCKCNMVPMFMLRVAGFIFAITALVLTEQFCDCAYIRLPEGHELLDQGGRRILAACPTSPRAWYAAARVLIFTMACDALFPAIALIVMLRKRISKCYRRVRPMRERSLEEVDRSWQLKCKRCCECSSLMTCYMCGGQNLTAGSYADVAMALTDFLDDEGSLDIVPSDIAAALICLVNVQKQKQIDCKNDLLKDGGLFAKDRMLATRLWRQFFNVKANSGATIKRQDSMRGISPALKNSLSMSITSSGNVRDIEIGTMDSIGEGQENTLCLGDEEKEEVKENGASNEGPSLSSLMQPTDAELENLRQMILTRKETMQRIDFRLIHRDSALSFEPTISTVLSPQNSFDCLVLGEGSRYCAVALAAYSWMMYMWTNKCTGCCELTTGSICNPQCCCSQSNDNIIGSDVCGWKQATVLKSLGIKESDLLYANFHNEVGVNPYLILLDTEWKTIVLAVRGTLSFEDMISDVTLTPKCLEETGEQFGFDGRGEYCHSGMYAGAKFIYDDLQRHKILDEAIEAHPDFGLRIIGHSLGAGVAAMLGRMLRQQYKNLYCLCFSPPGCVFSERTAKESKQYVCSYVLHNDIVPRLSFDSLVNLRNDLLEMIARIKVPKHKVFDSNFRHRTEELLLSLPDKLLHNREEIPSSPFLTEFEEFKLKQVERQKDRDRQQINMTVPGRILHMVRTSAKLDNVPCSCLLSCIKCIACCGIRHETKKYKVRWTEAKDLSEIYISPTMMVDHFPYNVARALDVAADSYGVADQASDLHERDQLERILENAKKDS